jgi:CBS domain-containing protein
MHTVRNLLRTQSLVHAPLQATVREVTQLMTRSRVGAVIVLDGERLAGVFSERDLMTRVVAAGRDPDATFVSEVMTQRVVTAEVYETRSSCLEKMTRAGCRHLPVLSDGRPIAMLSMRDFLRDEIEEKSEEIRELRAYIQQDPI